MVPKRKPRVLIAEGGNHFKCIENTYHLLHTRCDLTFYYTESYFGVSDRLFPSKKNAKTIENKFHSTFYFLWLIFIGSRYEYIDVSTGPEGYHYTDVFRSLCFYVCCRLYGKKMILCLRNISPYLESTGGLACFIRSRCLKHISRFTFETSTQRAVFREDANLDQAPCGVRYDRYTDLLDTGTGPAPRNGERTRVGLLGGITPGRRDYKLICRVLSMMTASERSQLEFVTLGNCKTDRGMHIIEEISALVAVDWLEGWISDAQFDERGLSCDLLIAPQTEQYGTLKGSGSYGDAVYLRKKVILPAYADPDGEFQEMAVYYTNAEDLLATFREIKNIAKAPVDPSFYERFTTESVLKRLAEDLKLDCNLTRSG